MYRLRAHELDSFANNRFRQRQGAFQRFDLILRALHDDAAQHISFFRYADGSVGSDLALKAEAKNQMIKRCLAQISIDARDSGQDRRARKGDGAHIRPQPS